MIPITEGMVDKASSIHASHVAASKDVFTSSAVQKSIVLLIGGIMLIFLIRTLGNVWRKDKRTTERLRRKECRQSCRGGLFGFLQSHEKRRCMTQCFRENS